MFIADQDNKPRSRQTYSNEQTFELEAEFRTNNYVHKQRREQLAKQLGMWFTDATGSLGVWPTPHTSTRVEIWANFWEAQFSEFQS